MRNTIWILLAGAMATCASSASAQKIKSLADIKTAADPIIAYDTAGALMPVSRSGEVVAAPAVGEARAMEPEKAALKPSKLGQVLDQGIGEALIADWGTLMDRLYKSPRQSLILTLNDKKLGTQVTHTLVLARVRGELLVPLVVRMERSYIMAAPPDAFPGKSARLLTMGIYTETFDTDIYGKSLLQAAKVYTQAPNPARDGMPPFPAWRDLKTNDADVQKRYIMEKQIWTQNLDRAIDR